MVGLDIEPQEANIPFECVICGNELSDSQYYVCSKKCHYEREVSRILRNLNLDKLKPFDFNQIKTSCSGKTINLKEEISEYINSPTWQGFFFYGKAGRGKSHIAKLIVSRMVERWLIRPQIVSVLTFVNELQVSYATDTTEKVRDSVRNAKYLVFDDLGAEKGTEHAVATMLEIMDYRVRNHKPTIITSNIAPSEFQDERLISRIFEACRIRHIAGKDYRIKIMDDEIKGLDKSK